MRHCNCAFKAQDIWFLLDCENKTNRKLYLANCPICNKAIALYSYYDDLNNIQFEKYYYSNGTKRIKEELKKDVTSTMLGFRYKYSAPSGFKYGKNIEIKKNGKVIAQEQYSVDFWGRKILVKKIENG